MKKLHATCENDPSLETLTLTSWQLDGDTAVTFAQGLRYNTHLTVLRYHGPLVHVDSRSLAATPFSRLCSFASQHSMDVALQDDASLLALFGSIRMNKSLKVVSINAHKVRQRGIPAPLHMPHGQWRRLTASRSSVCFSFSTFASFRKALQRPLATFWRTTSALRPLSSGTTAQGRFALGRSHDVRSRCCISPPQPHVRPCRLPRGLAAHVCLCAQPETSWAAKGALGGAESARAARDRTCFFSPPRVTLSLGGL